MVFFNARFELYSLSPNAVKQQIKLIFVLSEGTLL
jgi:hypothetical protein